MTDNTDRFPVDDEQPEPTKKKKVIGAIGISGCILQTLITEIDQLKSELTAEKGNMYVRTDNRAKRRKIRKP